MTESRYFFFWLWGGFLAICIVGGMVACQRDGSSRKQPEEVILEQLNEEIVIAKVIENKRNGGKW